MGNLPNIYKRRTFPWFALMMNSALGLGVAAYLAIAQDSLGPGMCVYAFDCGAVLSGDFGYLRDVPVGIVGLTGYFLLSVILLRIFLSNGNSKLTRWLLFLASFSILLAELGMSLALSASQLLTPGAFCGLCQIHLLPALIGMVLGFVIFNDLMSNSIWRDDVVRALKKIKVSEDVITDQQAEKSIQAELDTQLAAKFPKVTREVHFKENGRSRFVDIEIGDGKIGIEVKRAESLKKTGEADRLIDTQVPRYKAEKFGSNLIVAIVGTKEEFENDKVIWVFNELDKLDTPYAKIPIIKAKGPGFVRSIFR